MKVDGGGNLVLMLVVAVFALGMAGVGFGQFPMLGTTSFLGTQTAQTGALPPTIAAAAPTAAPVPTAPAPTATPAARNATTFGLLPSGQRDKLLWPFSSTSAWNMPIGSSATLQPAGITQRNNGGLTRFVQDEDIVILKPTSPLIAIKQNNVGWNGGDRCPAQGGTLQTAPVPANYTIGSSGENNSTAILGADGHTLFLNQPFTRCTAGGDATALVTFGNEDIYQDGLHGGHGGSNLSALGGTIRLGEFPSGSIKHVMKVNLWAKDYYASNCSFHWPATTVDGYCGGGGLYGGSNNNFTPGALLTLPSQFNVNGLRTTPGKILAKAFQDYGAYVVDDTYWNAWAIVTEQGPDGKVTNEFQTLYGFSMRLDNDAALGTPFGLDMKDIFQGLNIVTNNSAGNAGGGGTPRVPLAPAIGN